ncbi:TlpA family protein disulfide reductase [Odoribacter lunatus]|uniref:TlpA family protein disulfide reductase n=1 Tax=Odoribacter lunatus TaxID=2941335 RepID=UPI00203B250F|nr:TlpA family protein disulfide reductase [Odoribacter lunatus]
MKRFIFPFMLCLLWGMTDKANAQGYNIKIKVEKMPGKNIILANYFEGKVYAVDTAKLDNNGVGYFSDPKKRLARGMYLLLFSNSNYFDLIIGDTQKFSITTDTLDVIHSIQFEGSPENTAFKNFQLFMLAQNQKSKQIREEYEKDPNKDKEDAKKAYTARFEQADKEVRAYIADLVKQYPHTALATFVNFTLSPEIPDFSKVVPEDTKDRNLEIQRRAYYYNKKHYWDYTNFTDSTLIRTPIFKNKLDDYFKNMVVVHPDSLYLSCVEILEKSRPCNAMFRYLMNYCLVYTFDNKIMGMDEAFVKLGQRYYIGGIVNWLDKDQMKKITDEVYKRQYNLLNHKAIDLRLPNVDGQWVSLHETKAPFILLLFWEPNCGHCKKQVPLAKKEIYERFGPHGLKVFAVNTHTKEDEWKKFIEEKELFDFINCWDPNRQSNYWTIYNVFSTPVMYILDKDKKIIAKNLAVDQMVDLLKKEYEKQYKIKVD